MGPSLNFKSTLSAILRDLRISTHRITGRTFFSLFFGRSPNTLFSNLHANSHPVVSDNRRVLTRGSAYDMSRPELSCLYDGSDEQDTPPSSPPKPRNVTRRTAPTPVQAPSAASPPPSCATALTRGQTVRGPARSCASLGGTTWLKSAPGAKSGTQNYVNITDLIVSESPLTVTLRGNQVCRKVCRQVCRKNHVRWCLGPKQPPGNFGTLVFVNPSATKTHKRDLAGVPGSTQQSQTSAFDGTSGSSPTPPSYSALIFCCTPGGPCTDSALPWIFCTFTFVPFCWACGCCTSCFCCAFG